MSQVRLEFHVLRMKDEAASAASLLVVSFFLNLRRISFSIHRSIFKGAIQNREPCGISYSSLFFYFLIFTSSGLVPSGHDSLAK